MNRSPTTTPAPVPMVPPMAPYMAALVPPSGARLRIRIHAARILTIAFMICSRICEMEVGVIVRCA